MPACLRQNSQRKKLGRVTNTKHAMTCKLEMEIVTSKTRPEFYCMPCACINGKASQ